MLLLRDGESLAAQIPSVQRSVRKYVDQDPVQREGFLEELAVYEEGGRAFEPRERHRIRAIRDAADHESDVKQRDIRRFRNLLVLTSLAMTTALIVLVVVHAIDP